MALAARDLAASFRWVSREGHLRTLLGRSANYIHTILNILIYESYFKTIRFLLLGCFFVFPVEASFSYYLRLASLLVVAIAC